MRGWYSNMLQVSRAKSCTCHATWKGLSSKGRRSMQNERCYLHKAGWRCRMLKILQIPRKRLLFVSLLFWHSWFRFACFCKTLRATWLHGFVCVHLFTATNATSLRKLQTRPTLKQRPQHQQLLVFLQLHHHHQQQQQQQQQPRPRPQ